MFLDVQEKSNYLSFTVKEFTYRYLNTTTVQYMLKGIKCLCVCVYI